MDLHNQRAVLRGYGTDIRLRRKKTSMALLTHPHATAVLCPNGGDGTATWWREWFVQCWYEKFCRMTPKLLRKSQYVTADHIISTLNHAERQLLRSLRHSSVLEPAWMCQAPLIQSIEAHLMHTVC